ncbi:MAG: hypothetical protein COA86_18925 [Kangiella sp.]|nr:MAG: hypothetical protein COA86_18925 [Kangiella sp.]
MYDFHKTVEKIEDLDWHEMSNIVQQEISTSEKNAYSGKPGCVKHREMGAPEYSSRMKALAFFLGNCIIPAGASSGDIDIYKNISEKLISKGQFKPEVINVFSS